MRLSKLDRLWNQSKQWPSFSGSWEAIPVNTSSLTVDRRLARSLAQLARFKRLRHLSVRHLRAQDFVDVAAIHELRTLLIWGLNADSFQGLSALNNLVSIGVMHAPALTSLSGLNAMKALKHIHLYHVPKMRLLEPLGALSALEELALETSWGTDKPLCVDSLKPLSKLQRLEFVDLRGVWVEDGSLAPLATLPRLRHLFPCSYSFDINELAYLADRLNSQLSRKDRITPTVKIDDDDELSRCKKCNSQKRQLVGKSGPRYRLSACPKCDNALIAAHVAVFESARALL
jgi:hypothetical protein